MKLFIIPSLIATVTLLIFMSFSSISSESDDYIIVEVHTANLGRWDKKIIVVEGSQIVKTVPLERNSDKYWEKNAILISRTLNEIKQKGYRLIESHGGTNGPSGTAYFTYIFEK